MNAAPRHFAIANEEETAALAGRLARALPPGSCLSLEGPLGAGKSSFARAFLRHLGVTGSIPSPTFTLVQSYATATGPVHHLDLYRLDDDEAARQAGLEDLIHAPDARSLVEWPSRCPGILPLDAFALSITIPPQAGTARLFTISPGLDL